VAPAKFESAREELVDLACSVRRWLQGGR